MRILQDSSLLSYQQKGGGLSYVHLQVNGPVMFAIFKGFALSFPYCAKLWRWTKGVYNLEAWDLCVSGASGMDEFPDIIADARAHEMNLRRTSLESDNAIC